ncbi:hypothetical protein KDX04_27220 [Burkholderia cenocepacia]|uniref:hypothetical protein n=1 Tax=Burkholderia cenocepacia TaxID=95486 RepID=UPI001B969E24|nr:hypothetical protein [Burkholderia cenocepacia]MBR7989526.1 hypothetical protein [Burkholderia cenocepacia]
MEISNVLTGLIGTVFGAVITAGVNHVNSRRTLNHSRETLDVQRTANARAVATFIADKRQKWIDDLRSDVSLYLGLTAELTDAWRRQFGLMGDIWDRSPARDQSLLDRIEDKRVKFLNEIAPRDSEHYQALSRIFLRLNHKELSHQRLVTSLRSLRAALAELQMRAIRDEYANHDIYAAIEVNLNSASNASVAILKEEWQRLKLEVADPDQLIEDIRATKSAVRNVPTDPIGTAPYDLAPTPSSAVRDA